MVEFKTAEEMQAEFEAAMQSGIYTWGEVLFEVITRRPKSTDSPQKEENAEQEA